MGNGYSKKKWYSGLSQPPVEIGRMSLITDGVAAGVRLDVAVLLSLPKA